MLIVPAKSFDKLNFKANFYNKDYKGADNVAFFTLGRYALLYTLEHFGIKKHDNIICPAYYCNSSLEPLLSKGYDVTFIDITIELKIDIEILILEIENNNSKAIILPNYFGLFDTSSERIYEECKKRGVIVIKDFAHSYLSYLYDIKLQFCDAIILSMRKSVNIHYGGGAIFTNKKLQNTSSKRETFLSKFLFEFMKRVEQTFVLSGFNIYGETITHLMKVLNKEKQHQKHIEINTSQYEIKGVESKYLLNKNSYSKEIASLRRINLLNLKNLLATSGVTSPFIKLNDEVPQVYPIFGDNEFCTYLRNNGIGATMWPFSDIPTEVKNRMIFYPNTDYFHKHLICLPIHQGLSENHLKKISEIIHSYVSNKK